MVSSDAVPKINHDNPNANLFSSIDCVTPCVVMFARCFATRWFIYTIWCKFPLQKKLWCSLFWTTFQKYPTCFVSFQTNLTCTSMDFHFRTRTSENHAAKQMLSDSIGRGPPIMGLQSPRTPHPEFLSFLEATLADSGPLPKVSSSSAHN